MYIPIAIYKNNLVLIDNMDTFALYFCASIKQKMRPVPGEPESGADEDGISPAERHDAGDEFGEAGYSSDDSFGDAMDDDDDL